MRTAHAFGRSALAVALLAALLLAVVAPAVHCGPAAGAAPVPHPVEQTDMSVVTGSGGSFISSTAAGLLQQEQQPVTPARRLQQQCKAGTHRCGARCVSDADPKTCGRRCSPCPAPASGNGNATCSRAGACTISCRKGFQAGQDCATPKSCKPVCRRVCPAGQQPNARSTACIVCPADTYKPRAGVAACTRCPAGTRAPGKQASDHDAAGDCKPVVLLCPSGQEADTAAAACRVCSTGFYKDAAGPGPCTRCPPGTAAAGDLAEDHDAAEDCYPISCPPGKERDTVAGGCRVCPADTFKAEGSPSACTACPPGTTAQGPAAADHDDASDCINLNLGSCPAGQQADAGTSACVVCPPNTFKPAAGAAACVSCPDGTRTLGQQASDHDEPGDCIPGGLLPSGNRTSAPLLDALANFDALFERSLNNTGKGGRGGRGGGSGGRGGRTRACLYDCEGVEGGVDTANSKAVAYLAGSPLAYRSDDPADVRAGVNLLGEVLQQGTCGTCVNAALTAAATAAVASALRVDARTLEPLAPDYAYHCGFAAGEAGPRRLCGTGWGFEAALVIMQKLPILFSLNSSCLAGTDLARLSLDRVQLKDACIAANTSFRHAKPCGEAWFSCTSVSLAQGVWSVQRHIRLHGSAATRLKVTDEFKRFFETNRTGIFNTSTVPPEGTYFWHAVVLVGYNNTGYYWIARNSWGANWADGGTFRIAYGALGIGHPEDTYGLECSPTSSDAATLAAWSDPWPVTADPAAPGCHLYTATARDTISGIAGHFGVDVLQLVQANTDRGVIPTQPAGDPPRPEPQLDGPWGGKVFQLCGIPQSIFTRVALVNCTGMPEGGNATWGAGCSGLSAGQTCAGSCDVGFAGSPVALCGIDARWTVNGSCSPEVKCDGQPNGGDAVWPAACSGLPAGSRCNTTCKAGFTGALTATCGSDGQWVVSSGCSRSPGPIEVVHTLNVDGFSYTLHLYPRRNWIEARKHCQADGRDLVRLYSREHGARLHAAVAQNTSEHYWLGLTDTAQEGSWVWSLDGATLSATEAGWQPGEPNDLAGAEDCGEVRHLGTQDLWNDKGCADAMPFVCSPVLTVTSGVQAHYQKPKNINVDGVSYTVHRVFANWTEADKRCRQDGQQLLRLYSRQQGANVHAAVSRTMAKPHYWLGLTDAVQQGTWVWSADGATLSGMESDWGQGQPMLGSDAPKEDCATSGWEDANSHWHDHPCGKEFAFVCGPATITSACARYPCVVPATCTPASTGPALSPADRTCSCPAGQVHIDGSGCVRSTVPETELDALLAVKAAVDPSDQALPGWRRPSDASEGYCSWEGITCNNGGNVTEIKFLNKDLRGGKLPSAAALLGLPHLTRLRFQHCGLGGKLPERLPPSLRVLALGNNSISGTLPDWSSASLEEVYLWRNRLNGTLPAWRGLQRLTTVVLQHNALTGTIPASWATAPWAGSATYIDVSFNRLAGELPAEWGPAMVKLRELWANTNSLTGVLSDSWRLLLEMRALVLWNNALTGTLPAWLGGLSNLEILSFDINALGGTLPQELGQLAKLQELYLSSNSFVGSIPTEWVGMDAINQVTLWNNSGLTGCLPAVWQGKVNQEGSGRGVDDLIYGTNITGWCPATGAVVARAAAPVAAGLAAQQAAAVPTPSRDALSGGPPPAASMRLHNGNGGAQPSGE